MQNNRISNNNTNKIIKIIIEPNILDGLKVITYYIDIKLFKASN